MKASGAISISCFSIHLATSGHRITATGQKDNILQGEKVILDLAALMASGYAIREDEIRQAIALTRNDPGITLKNLLTEYIPINSRKRVIFPKSAHQLEYIQAIKKNDIVFGIGPAGTGKTYLAMAMAAYHLLKHSCRKIILVRPAVEAGEKLGFLPGDIAEKINPYLRPLYDALFDMIDADKVQKMMEKQEMGIHFPQKDFGIKIFREVEVFLDSIHQWRGVDGPDVGALGEKIFWGIGMF